MYTTPKSEMENLKLYGWTGTYKNVFALSVAREGRR